jgi:hypothetical protein
VSALFVSQKRLRSNGLVYLGQQRKWYKKSGPTMDTKRLQQRVVGSGAAVDNKLHDISSAAETVARHMDWRLGNARMDEKLTLQEDDSELDEEGFSKSRR